MLFITSRCWSRKTVKRARQQQPHFGARGLCSKIGQMLYREDEAAGFWLLLFKIESDPIIYHLAGDIVSGLQDNPVLDVIGGALTPVKWLGNLLSGDPTLSVGAVPEASGRRVEMTGWLGNQAADSWFEQMRNTLGLHSNQTFLNSFYRRAQQLAAPKGGQ